MFSFLKRNWQNLVAEPKLRAKALAKTQMHEHTIWLLIMFPVIGVGLYTFGDCVLGWPWDETRLYYMLNWILNACSAEYYIHLIHWIVLWSILAVFVGLRYMLFWSSVYLKHALELDISPVSKDSFIGFWKRTSLTAIAFELTICFLLNGWVVYGPILFFMPRSITKVVVITLYQNKLSSEPFPQFEDAIPPISTYTRDLPFYIICVVLFWIVPIVYCYDYYRQWLESNCENLCTCTIVDTHFRE